MPFTVHCPSGHAFLAPESYSGREVRCPFCQQTTVVSAPGKPQEERTVDTTLSQISRGETEHVTATSNPSQASDFGTRGDRSRLEGDFRQFRVQRFPVGTVIGLTLVALSNVAPVPFAITQGYTGPWLTILVGMALLEIGATSLLVIFPDWCSLKTTGNVFGMTAALFGMAATFLAFASEARLQALAIASDLQDAAARWMISLMAIQATTAFLCYRSAETWRRRTSAILVRNRPR